MASVKYIFLIILSLYGAFSIISTIGLLSRHGPQNNPDTDANTNIMFKQKSRHDNIAIAVKTGLKTAASRLPIQMMTFLKNIDNVYVFGDYDTKIGETSVEGVLRNLYPDNDFTVERPPKIYAIGPSEDASQETIKGWMEDAHKNIPAFKKLYELYPNKEWYFMIDDDTYVFMDSLQKHVKNLNPNKPYFIGNYFEYVGCGAQKFGNTENPYFAHGGSGILLSRDAILKLIKISDKCIKEYRKCWAGDVRVALCLRDAGIRINMDLSVGFQAEPPGKELDFPKDSCQRQVTMHHLTPSQFQTLYHIESNLSKQQVTMWDVFGMAYKKNEVMHDVDWSNKEHIEQPTIESSSSNCAQRCRMNKQCVAWIFDKKKLCWLKDVISATKSVKGSTSGIITDNYKCRK